MSESLSLEFFHLVSELATFFFLPFFFYLSGFFYGRKFLLALAETVLIVLICTEVIFLLSSQSIKRSCPESLEKEVPAAGLVSDAK